MRKPIQVLEAEDALEAVRTRAAAEPDNMELAMQVTMAERALQLAVKLATPRPMCTQEHIDAVRNTVDIAEFERRAAYNGGVE
jgi:hypothetical protein